MDETLEQQLATALQRTQDHKHVIETTLSHWLTMKARWLREADKYSDGEDRSWALAAAMVYGQCHDQLAGRLKGIK